jgi:hypothetical protein
MVRLCSPYGGALATGRGPLARVGPARILWLKRQCLSKAEAVSHTSRERALQGLVQQVKTRAANGNLPSMYPVADLTLCRSLNQGRLLFIEKYPTTTLAPGLANRRR